MVFPANLSVPPLFDSAIQLPDGLLVGRMVLTFATHVRPQVGSIGLE